jgi:hypothetical protein
MATDQTIKQIKVNGLTKLRNVLKRKFKIIINKTLRDKALRLRVGKIVEQDIRDNFNETPAEFTKDMRAYLEQFNKTHPDYRRSKINITFTGELLDDLAKNVKADTTKLAFIIEHSNKKHKAYKQASQTKRGRKVTVTSLKSRKTRDVRDTFSKQERKTHKEISEHIINDHGYDYLKISDKAEKDILKLIRNTILDNVRREFGT